MDTTKELKFDPNLLKGTWWTTFNPKGEEADFQTLQNVTILPAQVQSALTTAQRDANNLGEEDVNWNLQCVATNGGSILKHVQNLPGGPRTGGGCGEDALWAVPEGVNKKNVAKALGSAAFGYKGIIYVIDGGLCPCLRCCKSLLGLAKTTESIILVRPITDYEMVKQGRTALDQAHTFVLIFFPDKDKFFVCHTKAAEAPRAVASNKGPLTPSRFTCPTPLCDASNDTPYDPTATKDVKAYCATANAEVTLTYVAGNVPW